MVVKHGTETELEEKPPNRRLYEPSTAGILAVKKYVTGMHMINEGKIGRSPSP